MAKLRENKFALALIAGLALALVVGIAYSVSTRSARIAAYAESLDAAHEAVQAATVVRSQLELAAYEDSLRAEGVEVDDAAIAAAVARASAALRDFAAQSELLIARDVAGTELDASAADLGAAADAIIARIGDGTVIDREPLDSAYSEVIAELRPLRNDLAASIATSGTASRWTTAIAGFLAVFVIPAAVITAYFIFDRRRRRQHELEVTLKAERAAHESRESFLTAVSHQLREPLWAVRGISRMLGNDDILMAQPHMADLHTLLAGELDDMNSLMDNLLTASRLESGAIEYAIEPVDIREETKAIVDGLNHRGANLYVAMDDGVVDADRRRLSQIVRNLISNALKYGGPNIEVKGFADGDTYTIVVVDDGQGVPKDVESQLFSRFTHKGEAQNVGLGLSIVMALAVGMGGTAFHAREDGLTRFGVRLPVSSDLPQISIAPGYVAPAFVEAPKDLDQ